MKTFIIRLLALSLFSGGLAAQTLRGKIVAGNDEPVPHAAIYIRERSQGIATDDRGVFVGSTRFKRWDVGITVSLPLFK